MALFNISTDTYAGQKIYVAKPGGSDAGKTASYGGNDVFARRISKATSSVGGMIDVYNSFDWSTSPYPLWDNTLKDLIPFARIKEMHLKDDAIYNALKYYTTTVLQTGNTTIQNMLKKIADALGINSQQTSQSNSTTKNWMTPYDGLYSTDTKDCFTFTFPYFDNKAMNNVVGNYEDISTPTGGFNIAKTISNTAEEASNVSRLFVAPGQYIEKPKLFSAATAGNPSITVSFPLLNTLNFASAVKNFQLLWLLIFQNTPQRLTKTIINFPSLYEVHVPGVTFMNYAHMSNMQVDFIGNRRMVEVDMPPGPDLPARIKVVMPDAYNVTMTFTSLVVNANNLSLENWKRAGV